MLIATGLVLFALTFAGQLRRPAGSSAATRGRWRDDARRRSPDRDPDRRSPSARPARAGRRRCVGVVALGRAPALPVLLLGWGAVPLGCSSRWSSTSSRCRPGRGSSRAAARRRTGWSPRWSGPPSASRCVPLVWLLYVVLKNGLAAINTDFLTYSMRNVIGDEQGGIYHALIGTLLITLAAAVISVPIGIFAAIYLVEYGKGNRLARRITFLVDVMTGIPSIVAGLFALSLFVLIFGPALRFGFGGVGGAVAADDPDRRPLDRGDAAAGSRRPARGVVRPGRAEVAHDRQGRAAHRPRRHRHRRRAGHLPRHRRDRAAAGHRRRSPTRSTSTCSTAG